MDWVLSISSAMGRIKGVDQYILVDSRGSILSHEMEEPESISPLVHSCGRRLSALGGKHFIHAVFLRKNKRNLLIFPVGIYHLGVIKQAGMDNAQVAEAVMECLDRHSAKGA